MSVFSSFGNDNEQIDVNKVARSVFIASFRAISNPDDEEEPYTMYLHGDTRDLSMSSIVGYLTRFGFLPVERSGDTAMLETYIGSFRIRVEVTLFNGGVKISSFVKEGRFKAGFDEHGRFYIDLNFDPFFFREENEPQDLKDVAKQVFISSFLAIELGKVNELVDIRPDTITLKDIIEYLRHYGFTLVDKGKDFAIMKINVNSVTVFILVKMLGDQVKIRAEAQYGAVKTFVDDNGNKYIDVDSSFLEDDNDDWDNDDYIDMNHSFM